MRDFLDSDMKRFKRDADLRTLCIQSGGTVVENSCVRCK